MVSLFLSESINDVILSRLVLRSRRKKQKKDYVVRINIKAINAARERERIRVDKCVNTSRRAGIEGTNSALKRKGLGKLPVRGIHKVSVVSGFKVTAQNIKRFIKYKQGGYKPGQKIVLVQGTTVPVTG